MHTAFLIGATGHVGRHLLGELAPDHADGRMTVRVGVRSDEAAGKVSAAGLDQQTAQLRWGSSECFALILDGRT